MDKMTFEQFDAKCKQRLKEKGYSINDKTLLVTYNVILLEMLMELNDKINAK